MIRVEAQRDHASHLKSSLNAAHLPSSCLWQEGKMDQMLPQVFEGAETTNLATVWDQAQTTMVSAAE